MLTLASFCVNKESHFYNDEELRSEEYTKGQLAAVTHTIAKLAPACDKGPED